MINLNNTKLVYLSIITIVLFSFIGSLGSYFTQLGNERVYGPLVFTLVICLIASTLSYKHLRYSTILFFVLWTIYFKIFYPLVIVFLTFISILRLGHLISNLLNCKNSSIFIKFCLGHTLLGFLLWIIIRFGNYNSALIFKLVGIVLVINSLYYCRKLLEKTKLIDLSNLLNDKSNLFFNQSVLILIISYGIYSSIYSFYFDDINGYLYAPLRVYFDGGFIFGPDRPGFMTNMSALSLGYGSLFSSFLGFDRNLFILTFKFFNSASYLLAIVTFVISIKSVVSNNLRGVLVLLIGLLPLIVFEITGNYADYYVLLMSFYIMLTGIDIIFNKIKFTCSYFYLNSLLIGLLIIVSLKNLPYLISSAITVLVLLLINLRPNFKKILSLLLRKKALILICIVLILTPILILFADNYRLTGNPTFPGGNGLWKSAFFDTKGIVAGRFHFPNFPDGSTFVQLFSFTPQASQLFSSGNSYFPIYGVFSQTILYLIPFILMYVIYINNNNSEQINYVISVSIVYIILILISFIVITNIVGPQHRYFFGLNTFLFTIFVIIISNISFNKIYTSIFVYLKWIFISLAVFTFFGNGIETPPFKLTSDGVLTSSRNSDKWISKKIFYDKVNNYISDDKSIMLYYLQDKFFINSKHVFELDWYDYPVHNSLNTIWNSSKYSSKEEKINDIRKNLCDRNFKYFILSKNVFIYDKMFNEKFLSDEIIKDDNHSLFILKCP